jgi:hypothetical protein
MAEGEPGWPPPYAAALDEDREGLGLVLRTFGVDQGGYDRAIEITREIVGHPEFKRLQAAIARPLSAVPRLDAIDIEAICAVQGFPTPNQEEELRAA